ncbi:TRAP transporter small permease [Marinomonas pollencensis]|uniref:TRAP transporter small permease protein n=1 Tax=Marinomonas pollencensis TaxID=491954 RepID=A0A3E0DLI4_9GAMM|nr:TRAP transporter small permease subunit [Marinomonas pollencensis]REG82641.1 tripartite ATP-independent transporter DctQ subunit [Marinomonas pollencensis]
MKAVSCFIARITHFMHLIGGFFLVAMMLVTLADVAARGLFGITEGSVDWTFTGGIELVKYSLLFTVLFILPHSVSRSQVIVDLFTDGFKDTTKRLFEAFYSLCFGVLGGAMSYSFYLHIEDAAMSYETTQDLMIPLTYFYSVATFATVMLAIAAFVYAFELLICGKAEA